MIASRGVLEELTFFRGRSIKEENMENYKLILEKPRLQRMYTDFLTKMGYEHELEEQGDIAFQYQDVWYSIEIYDEDLEFGRLCLMIEADLNETEIQFVLIAASEVNKSLKLPKAYLRDKVDGKQFIVFSIGYLLTNPGDFKKHFERMTDEIFYAYQRFCEMMKELKET